MRRRWYAACAAITLAAGLPRACPADERAVGGLPALPDSVFSRSGPRDPFTPPGWRLPETALPPTEDAETAPAAPEPEMELRLTGIIRSGSDRLAIVNGRILETDERVVLRRGRRAVRLHVVDVGEEDVLVSVDGRQNRLRLEHGNLGGLR